MYKYIFIFFKSTISILLHQLNHQKQIQMCTGPSSSPPPGEKSFFLKWFLKSCICMNILQLLICLSTVWQIFSHSISSACSIKFKRGWECMNMCFLVFILGTIENVLCFFFWFALSKWNYIWTLYCKVTSLIYLFKNYLKYGWIIISVYLTIFSFKWLCFRARMCAKTTLLSNVLIFSFNLFLGVDLIYFSLIYI